MAFCSTLKLILSEGYVIGHKGLRMTKHYTHATGKSKRRSKRSQSSQTSINVFLVIFDYFFSFYNYSFDIRSQTWI